MSCHPRRRVSGPEWLLIGRTRHRAKCPHRKSRADKESGAAAGRAASSELSLCVTHTYEPAGEDSPALFIV